MTLKFEQKPNLFLKSLIESDFLLVDQKSKKDLRYIKSFNKTKDSSLLFLDPLETVKTVKQLVRLLQFLKKQNSSVLHLLVENKQYLELAETFFKTVQTNSLSVLVKENLPSKSFSNNTLQLLIMLNFSLNNRETTFKRIFDKNIFLINKINAKFEKNNWGTYKIYNDLNDFKKLVFLLITIQQTLIKKNLNISETAIQNQ
jgi:hypothetical protein